MYVCSVTVAVWLQMSIFLLYFSMLACYIVQRNLEQLVSKLGVTEEIPWDNNYCVLVCIWCIDKIWYIIFIILYRHGHNYGIPPPPPPPPRINQLRHGNQQFQIYECTYWPTDSTSNHAIWVFILFWLDALTTRSIKRLENDQTNHCHHTLPCPNRSCCDVTRADSQRASKLKSLVSSDINSHFIVWKRFVNDLYY